MADSDQSTNPSAPAGATAAPRRVNAVSPWTLLLMAPLALTLRVWLMTLRLRLTPESLHAITGERGPIICCTWHNRLILGSELHRRFRSHLRLNGLVSASKDGAWLVAFFQLVGVSAVRGSSSWRGGQAVFELFRKLKAGEDIAITPDGPRGPAYEFKKGPAGLALKSGRPVLLLGSTLTGAFRFNSWDRFAIPYPFSRVEVRAELVRASDYPELTDEDAFAELLQEKMRVLTGDADAGYPPRVKRRS